jgi:hypothetical protein
MPTPAARRPERIARPFFGHAGKFRSADETSRESCRQRAFQARSAVGFTIRIDRSIDRSLSRVENEVVLTPIADVS